MRLATVASLSLGLCLLPLTAVAELEQLYFSEDFSTADRTRSFFEGTLEERQFRYVDNEYEIDTSAGNAYGQSVLLEELDTYRVEVTGRMIQAGDNDSGFGLSFNYRERENEESPAGDYLLFLVYDRASYTVLRYLAGNTTILY